MKVSDLLAHLEYIKDRTSNPCYNQLEAGFRHSALTRKEIEERKDDCLKEVAESCDFLIRKIQEEGIE